MRTGDRLCDLAERGIGFAGIFETVLRHDDRVCPSAPFPHKPRPWPDAWTGIRSNNVDSKSAVQRNHAAPLCLSFYGGALSWRATLF
jgi:hypothetical protein